MKLDTWLIILIESVFNYRFLNRVVGARFSSAVTLPILLLCGGLYGYVNVRFAIATTIMGNVLYYSAGMLLLNRLLFHGRLMKLAFYTILLQCGGELVVSIFFSLIYAFWNGSTGWLTCLYIARFVVVALRNALLEYAGRRLQSLRYDLPAGYPFGLLVIVYVCFVSFTMMDLLLYVSGDEPIFGSLIGSVFVAVGVAVLILMLVTVDRQLSLRLTGQQALLQAAHYKSRADDWKQTARVRHDIKNHLLCLDGLLRAGKPEQALYYIETLAQAVERLSDCVHTGNDFVDAIVNEKRAEALGQGIACTIDMALPEESRVTPPDLCCVLSNVLDNAIEAAAQASEKWIEAQASARQGQLVLTVRNSCQSDGQRHLFTHRAGRGYGLGNVRRVVEKYGGTMEVSAKGCFTFSAILPL